MLVSTGSGDQDKWYKYTHDDADPSDEGMLDGIGNDIKFAMSKASYNFRNSVKEWMSEVLRVLFEAASLVHRYASGLFNWWCFLF